MNRLLLSSALSLLACAAALPARAADAPAAKDAMTSESLSPAEQEILNIDRVSYLGPTWNERVAKFHEDNLTREPGGIAMVGDSITDWCPFEKFFPGANIANRGIASDIIVGIIRREQESFIEMKPGKVFLLIGVNNIASEIEKPMEQYELQYRLLYKRIRAGAPQAKVYIQSVMPVFGGLVDLHPTINAKIDEVNALQKRLAGEFEFEYLDLKAVLGNEKGELKNNARMMLLSPLQRAPLLPPASALVMTPISPKQDQPLAGRSYR
jgi:hypothetical protein